MTSLIAASASPLIIILLVLALAWIFLIRPQKRRQVQQSAMLQNIQVGDEILTAGGFYAHVREIEEDRLTVEIAPGTNIRIARRAVAAVIPPDDEAEEEEEELTAGEKNAS